jgi:hypothetical protein
MSKRVEAVNWEKSSSGDIGNTVSNLDKLDTLLGTTGCGFCLAKFKQVTMHLGTGMTHACHHPTPHKIPLHEIAKNPAALFNTSHLKQARKQMLNDVRPSECNYCWRVEDQGKLSDRHFKSIEEWALPYHDEIATLSGDEDLYPSYLEVSFNNTCNLACVYCGPEFSSKWVEQLKSTGPVKVLEGTEDEQWLQGWQDLDSLSYKNRDFNPYVDAFWKWFPDAYRHLKHYRITGGEPLLSKETFKSMDWFINNPNPELEFSINSNFSVPDKVWDRFIDKLAILKTGDLVKRVTIYTSVEGWGERAEYARQGLDFDLFKKRYEQIVSMGNVRCIIMAAYNIFSVTSFGPLLEWVNELKHKYNPSKSYSDQERRTGFSTTAGTPLTTRDLKNPDHHIIVGIDIPYLRNPTCLDAQYVTHDLVEKYMIPDMKFMASNSSSDMWNEHMGFERYETDKLKRIVTHRMNYSKKNEPEVDQHEHVVIERAKFYEYTLYIDSISKTKFLDVFPEMENFYNVCKAAKDNMNYTKGISENEQ